MILCVCPNLCYDRVLVVPGFAVGAVHRAAEAIPLASGKGLNVARAARALGVPALVTGFVAGEAAGPIVRGAREAGLSLDAVRIEGPGRLCTLIIDPGRSETVVNERGASVDAVAVRRLRRRIAAHLPRSSVVVLNGSQPPGLPARFFASLIGWAKPRPVILDTPGEAFRLGVAAGPSVAKLNRRELADSLGRRLTSVHDVARAGRQLLAAGAQAVVVTLGEKGAVLVQSDAAWLVAPPEVERVNTIGAGDSLSAGIAVGLFRKRSLVEAVRLGVAAAAADVTTLLPGAVESAVARSLERRVRVEQLT
ncbi:MAG: hexose kinase [Armatimonadota bacterium]|nr:hexose kinase [Armatimonadota bacterium]MDR7451554.1 hexose kinase [Armatimonadota bacterium]MDR7467521.1 hexose kinase [Armatimonadota bacterium]MDR7494395.1 hexose kinase [Armatimonadota bacterium]MDR7499212.1 hexose kinase [Armatimonadota bacterium]